VQKAGSETTQAHIKELIENASGGISFNIVYSFGVAACLLRVDALSCGNQSGDLVGGNAISPMKCCFFDSFHRIDLLRLRLIRVVMG